MEYRISAVWHIGGVGLMGAPNDLALLEISTHWKHVSTKESALNSRSNQSNPRAEELILNCVTFSRTKIATPLTVMLMIV